MHPVGGPALAFLGALVGFAAVARFSYQMVDTKSGLEALWLPNGVVVALFVLVPRKWRLWVLLGMLPGEFVSDTLQGYPLPVIFAFSLTDMLESAVAGLVLLRIAGRRPRGDRQRDFYAILIAAAIAPIPGGLIGAAIEHIQWSLPFQGSFLLWCFWGAIIGLFVWRSAKEQEAPVMIVYLATFLGIVAILCKQSPFKLLPPPAPQDGVGEILPGTEVAADPLHRRVVRLADRRSLLTALVAFAWLVVRGRMVTDKTTIERYGYT